MSSDHIFLPQRSVIRLDGPDTMALLERLVTNATTHWKTGEARYGALLTPQGKVIADYLALRTETGALLDVANAHAADLAKRLKMFRLRSDVDIALAEDLHVWASIGADPDPIANAAYAYRDPRYQGKRARILTKGTAPESDPAGLVEYHLDRITNGIAEQGADFGTAAVFPAEINMDVLQGVALNKGCFVGQEVVSRMHRRGKIRKRTLVLNLPASVAVEPGDEIMAPLPIGTVSSVVDNRALALVRTDRLRSAEQSGEALKVHETPVTLEKPAWLADELARMEQS